MRTEADEATVRGERILKLYRRTYLGDADSWVMAVDAIADILHAAREAGNDTDDVLRVAVDHFTCERADHETDKGRERDVK